MKIKLVIYNSVLKLIKTHAWSHIKARVKGGVIGYGLSFMVANKDAIMTPKG